MKHRDRTGNAILSTRRDWLGQSLAAVLALLSAATPLSGPHAFAAGGEGAGRGGAGREGGKAEGGKSDGESEGEGSEGGEGEGEGPGSPSGSPPSSSSPGDGDPDAGAAPSADKEGSIEVRHPNGISETLESETYTMRDSRGRRIISRPATPADRRRLDLYLR